MRTHLPHHNFYNPGSEGHKGDRNFYFPEDEDNKKPVPEDRRRNRDAERERESKKTWEELKSGDYLAHLSMAVEERMVPVAADPEFSMVLPEEDEGTPREDTSKTTAFVWKDGKPNYLDRLKEAPKLKVPIRRTDLDDVRAFHRSESGTITEMPVVKREDAPAELRQEAAPQHPVHAYRVIDIAEDLRRLGNARDPRQVDAKELLAADALREGEQLDDDKRFELLYDEILGTEFIDPSGQRRSRNEVIHAIKQVREHVRSGNLAQAEFFLEKVPAAQGLYEKVRKLTRIQDFQMKHARESLDRAYDGGKKNTP